LLGRGEFDQTKVHQGRRLLAPTPLRTHELANGNVLTAKLLLAEPAGPRAAFVIEIRGSNRSAALLQRATPPSS
jgi:hypothetical protein